MGRATVAALAAALCRPATPALGAVVAGRDGDTAIAGESCGWWFVRTNQPGVAETRPDGDFYVLGTWVWDCPPYGS